MIRFLQISDIHFSDTQGSSDGYRQMKCKFMENLADCKNNLGKIDYVLICGDIAFSGQDSQYKEARQFISEICKKVGCKEENVFVVPGNHDKKREVYGRARSIMKDALIKEKNNINIKQLIDSKVKEPMAIGILYAPFKQYYKLAAYYSCISDIARKAALLPESNQRGEVPKFESNDEMYWKEQLGEINGFNITLFGSNTSLLSDQYDGESQHLEDGQHLQVLPLQAYNVQAKSNEINILMLHHPMTEIYDGENVGKVIDGLFKVQLYGHMHRQSSICENAVKIYSGALQPPKNEENCDYFPVYNVIELDVVDDEGTPCLKVTLFSRKWNGMEFVEYNEETKTGEDALRLRLPHNDAWERTMERVRKGEQYMGKEKMETTISPHAVKHAFLKSEKAQKIIKELYDNQFDNISPNRIKYLYFLKQVEIDGKFGELNELLKKYGK